MLSEIMFGKTVKGEIMDFTMLECCSCGIPFFVPSRWKDSKTQLHSSFNCPNGCQMKFIQRTEAERLKDELAAEKAKYSRETEFLSKRIRQEMQAKEDLKKVVKRIHKGVCPCCNRSFQNIARHIASKHPELLKK